MDKKLSFCDSFSFVTALRQGPSHSTQPTACATLSANPPPPNNCLEKRKTNKNTLCRKRIQAGKLTAGQVQLISLAGGQQQTHSGALVLFSILFLNDTCKE